MDQSGSNGAGDGVSGSAGQQMMRALGAGLAGAAVLTAAHEATRRVRPDAPRMDRLGARALERGLGALGWKVPRGRALYATTMAGDLLSNSLYYGALLLGRPRHPFLREALAGMVAGAGALWLPQRIGLGRAPKSTLATNKLLTMGLYLLGGLAAAAAFRRIAARA